MTPHNWSSIQIPRTSAIDRVIAEKSLEEFVKQAFHIVEPARALEWNWHLSVICEHLEAVTYGKIRRLIINIPPRSLKSVIVSVLWPAWEWTTRPSTQWIFASYASELSVRDNRRCRMVIESGWYQYHWGHKVKLKGDQNRMGEYGNSAQGHRLAIGTDSAGTGKGADRLVVDDPHKVAGYTAEKALKTAEWFDQELTTRLNDKRTGSIVVVMQRVEEDDLSAHLLKKGNYEHLCLPMEFNYDSPVSKTSLNFVDPRFDEGELLFPLRLGEEEIKAMKSDLGTRGYMAQMQQNPIPKAGNMVKREWFKYYTLLPTFERVVHSWDFSFKKTTDSDYVVGLAMGCIGSERYILPKLIRRKMNFTEMVESVIQLLKQYPEYHEVLIEAKANGDAIIDTLREHVSSIIAINPTDSKEARLSAVSPQIEAGNIFLPDPLSYPEATWVEEFLLELTRFPKVKHDDQVDAFTQALLRLKKNMGVSDLLEELRKRKEQTSSTLAGLTRTGTPI